MNFDFEGWYYRTWWAPFWPLVLFLAIIGLFALGEWLVVGHVS